MSTGEYGFGVSSVATLHPANGCTAAAGKVEGRVDLIGAGDVRTIAAVCTALRYRLTTQSELDKIRRVLASAHVAVVGHLVLHDEARPIALFPCGYGFELSECNGFDLRPIRVTAETRIWVRFAVELLASFRPAKL
jgi:hypothetical protein